MRAQLMATDEKLLKLLKEVPLFENVEMVVEKENLNSNCLIISDVLFSTQDLSEASFNDEQTVIYLLQNNYERNFERNIKSICVSKNIHLIPPRLTPEQIINSIVTIFESSKEEDTNVVTFFSPVSNIGTTTITLSVARSLQENTTAKIGVLLLNAWDHGTYFMDYKGKFLDQVKGKLSNQAISTKDELLSMFHMVEKDRLYVLGGNRYTKLERLYTKEEINYLISLSKKNFDVLLIDAGVHFDNALMVQSLYESDMRFLILNQQTKTIDRFVRLFDEILFPFGYKKSDFLAIINRYVDRPHFPSTKNICNELDVLPISTIREVDEGLLTEIEKKELYFLEDPYFIQSINEIVKPIINNASLSLVDNQDRKKKKRWFSIK